MWAMRQAGIDARLYVHKDRVHALDVARYVVAIVGPTAAGKSRLALEIAAGCDLDIVCCDSRQIYRYMDVGTAKPSRDERSAVRHYMLDLVEPDQDYSAQQYKQEASKVVRGLARHGRRGLVVGGTGFYLQALLDAQFVAGVPPNPVLREGLRAEIASRGNEPLHAELASIDPASAARIHPNNTSRLVRALEIVRTLGGPVPITRGTPNPHALILGVTSDRDSLYRTADARVDNQIRAGLVRETETLLAMGYAPESPGLAGFGYAQMVAHVREGRPLSQAIEEYKFATHAYIRRQYTWFRRDERIRWVESTETGLRQAIDTVAAWMSTAS